MLVFLFEGMMDLGVLELMGADSYLSGILLPMFSAAISEAFYIHAMFC